MGGGGGYTKQIYNSEDIVFVDKVANLSCYLGTTKHFLIFLKSILICFSEFSAVNEGNLYSGAGILQSSWCAVVFVIKRYLVQLDSQRLFSFVFLYSVQQLEDRQVATRRYDGRANDVNYWLENMEDKLGKLDLEVQDIQAVDLQIQHLKVWFYYLVWYLL